MFHSDAFVERLNRTPGVKAVGVDAGHWLMLERPDEVAAEIREWTDATHPANRLGTILHGSPFGSSVTI